MGDSIIKFPSTSLQEDIYIYLEELQNHSPNTRESYERDIREFFFFKPVEKKLEHVYENDMKQIRKTDLLSYRNYLSTIKNNSNKTINIKIY
ncbi:Phage integrase, N-terminal SAM-like domain [Terribacillus aidingensis]|uniref:Phage integrase, N-terminal SAM-like domain n=1 Tax=Terribacillus aidingensis TaxID=586416 RepID=A0A285NKH8_9BACI|nr:site-specific integrase [Terribacillus aidingensis]SNZ10002.1 Phage integrase, N-terminal SAM-like domain [Terribacillus aidingensis]